MYPPTRHTENNNGATFFSGSFFHPLVPFAFVTGQMCRQLTINFHSLLWKTPPLSITCLSTSYYRLIYVVVDVVDTGICITIPRLVRYILTPSKHFNLILANSDMTQRVRQFELTTQYVTFTS